MKPSTLSLLALMLPVTLAAQQQQSSAPANPITTVFKNRTLYLHQTL